MRNRDCTFFTVPYPLSHLYSVNIYNRGNLEPNWFCLSELVDVDGSSPIKGQQNGNVERMSKLMRRATLGDGHHVNSTHQPR